MSSKVKTKDLLPDLVKAVRALTKARVLVGIPLAAGDQPGSQIALATIGYIMETGSPARNIPARPFLHPGVAAARDRIVPLMKSGVQAAIKADAAGVENALFGAGTEAVASVKSGINNIIPPPLSERTLYNRQHRKDRPNDRTTPLRDKDDLFKAITFVIERK